MSDETYTIFTIIVSVEVPEGSHGSGVLAATKLAVKIEGPVENDTMMPRKVKELLHQAYQAVRNGIIDPEEESDD